MPKVFIGNTDLCPYYFVGDYVHGYGKVIELSHETIEVYQKIQRDFDNMQTELAHIFRLEPDMGYSEQYELLKKEKVNG